MPLNIEIHISPIPKRLCVPWKLETTIEQLSEAIRKRSGAGTECESFKVFRNGAELFKEDTLGDLGIKDEETLTFGPAPGDPIATKPKAGEDSTTVPQMPQAREDSTADQKQPESVDTLASMGISLEAPVRKLEQIDMVLLDVSGSMKGSAFVGDIMTRIEAAQAFFQTYLDKIHCHELRAEVGLICFGEKLDIMFPISSAFDNFSTELGAVEANQGSTRLFEAMILGAQTINQFRKSRASDLSPNCNFRLFCLTDGQDNSGKNYYEVYDCLHQHNIIIDSIAIGRDDFSKLSRLTRATGGSCWSVSSAMGGVELFEREAVLSPSKRDPFTPFPFASQISTTQHLDSLPGDRFARDDVRIKTTVNLSSTATPSAQLAQQASQKIDSPATSAVVKRIFKELRDFNSDPPPGWQLFVDDSDIMQWRLLLQGPAKSVYEDGYWMVSASFPHDYPFKPPKIRFQSQIFHCNINNDGNLCLDILKDQWSPALTVAKVCLSISSLLLSPNADDPLDVVKAGMYRDDPQKYWDAARQHTLSKVIPHNSDTLASCGLGSATATTQPQTQTTQTSKDNHKQR